MSELDSDLDTYSAFSRPDAPRTTPIDNTSYDNRPPSNPLPRNRSNSYVSNVESVESASSSSPRNEITPIG